MWYNYIKGGSAERANVPLGSRGVLGEGEGGEGGWLGLAVQESQKHIH